MKNLTSTFAASLFAVCLAAPVVAQSLTPSYATADHNARASKVIGMTAYNDHNEKIGTIDDILLPSMGGEATAVLSVGGFLGVGEKLVKVPLSHIHLTTEKPTMTADKATLSAMPTYNYGLGGNG